MNSNHGDKGRKFQNKMNHLQSMIGIPGQSSHCISRAQAREQDRIILEQQALGFGRENEVLLTRWLKMLINTTLTIAGKFGGQFKRNKRALDEKGSDISCIKEH